MTTTLEPLDQAQPALAPAASTPTQTTTPAPLTPEIASFALAPSTTLRELLDEALIDRLPLGVVVLDRNGFVVRYNRYEEQLARRRRQDVIGRHFFKDVAKCTNVPAIAGRFDAHVGSNTLSVDVDHVFALPFLPRPRDVRILMRSLEARGELYAVLLIEDVTARKDIERDRDRLMTVLVHDLKTPLTGILGYASLLARSPSLASADDKESAEAIYEASVKMRNMIQATLDDIRGSQGSDRRAQPVNVNALVLSSIGLQLPRARERRIRLFYNGELNRAEFPELSIAVRGHVEKLASVVDNLLSNAVKYARGEVRVSLDMRGDRVELVVADDGPGVPHAERARIFAEGYQSPGSLPGHGIGLFSVKRILDEQGGEVHVEGEPGRGATFRVLFGR